MPVTAFYAALIASLFLFLSRNVILARRAAKVAVGDGGDKHLLRAMRVQANCVEYAPIALLLMALSESLAVHVLILHGFGLALLTGRLVHAYGVSKEPEIFKYRVFGMALTLTTIAGAAVAALAGSMLSWIA